MALGRGQETSTYMDMDDPTAESRVKAMVDAADLFSIASTKTLINQYPEFLRDFGATPKVFATLDMLLTVAAAGVASHAVPLTFAMPLANDYRVAIPNALSQWRPGAAELLSEYLAVTEASGPRFGRQYAIAAGTFVVWGLARSIGLNRPAEETLRDLAPPLGQLVVGEFASWWMDDCAATA
jgi:hypothetical protein